MMFSVTPLGAAKGDVSGVSSAFVRYLRHGDGTTPEASAVTRYYGGEHEARWWGSGAALLGLVGLVDDRDLTTALSGRDPNTGARLLSARGSAGRADLKAGQPTLVHQGQPLWNINDARSALDLSTEAFDQAALDAGISFVELDGVSYLSGEKLEVLHLDVDPLVRLSQGDPGEHLSLKDASAIVGVSVRYLRMVAQATISDATKEGSPRLVAHKEGKRWMVTREALREFAEQRTPPAVRMGFDLTLTSEKSVSIAGLMGKGQLSETVMAAIRTANETGLGWFQDHAAYRRKGDGLEAGEGLIVASFPHMTSRNDDPHAHIHNVVINAVQDSNGDRRALDARLLYSNGRTAAALATAELRWQLTNQLGVRWEQSTSGAWEIAGISAQVRRAFSSRHFEVAEAVEQFLGGDGRDLSKAVEDSIALGSRARKSGITGPALVAQWWEKAAEVGFSPGDLNGIVRNQRPTRQLHDDQRDNLFCYLGGDNGVTENSTTFTYDDVVQRIVDWAPDRQLAVLRPDEITKLADRFITSAHTLTLDPQAVAEHNHTKGHISAQLTPTYTTLNVARRQARIQQRWDSAAGDRGFGKVDPRTVRAALDNSPSLSEEQRALVTAWTGNGRQYDVAIGEPGTGKTFAMATAARAWESQGYRVLGAAVKGTAAQILGDEANIESNTVASYLTKAMYGTDVLDSRTVLIVDEAGTLSDRDIDGLMHQAERTGATLRFIGDPEQHGSVGAGAMFNSFALQSETNLVEQRRLQTPEAIATAEAIRNDRPQEALEILDRHGHIIEASNETLVPLALREFFAARDAGDSSPVIVQRNALRREINMAAQQVRLDRGETSQLTNIGAYQLAVGDEVISKAPNRELTNGERHVLNGTVGTVQNVSKQQAIITFDGIGPISVGPQDLDSIDLAYAVTSHGVQGATYDQAVAIEQTGASKPQLVVDFTRARERTRAVIHDPTPDYEWVDAVAPREETTLEAVAASIKAEPHGTVFDLGVDLDGITRDMAIPIEQLPERPEALAARLVHEPPNQLVGTFPQRPPQPHLAARWDVAVIAAGTYIEQHQPDASTGPYGLGLAPADPAQRQQWETARTALARSAVAIALHRRTNASVIRLDPASPETLTQIRRLSNRIDRHIADRQFDMSHAPPAAAQAISYEVQDLKEAKAGLSALLLRSSPEQHAVSGVLADTATALKQVAARAQQGEQNVWEQQHRVNPELSRSVTVLLGLTDRCERLHDRAELTPAPTQQATLDPEALYEQALEGTLTIEHTIGHEMTISR